MQFRKVLVVHMSYHTEAHRRTLRTVRAVLEKKQLKNYFIHRAKLSPQHFNNCDIVIVVGGDGTFLKAAHFIKNETPVIGVNSDPQKKEGFFLRTYSENFEERLDNIISKREKPITLARLEARIDNQPVEELALNEFFVGTKKSYRMALYSIKIGSSEEHHKSSGVIVAAPAGSYAWSFSAGGKKVPITSKKVQYVVRELYRGKLTGHKLQRGFLKKEQEVIITSEMKDGILIADSVGKEHPVSAGSTARIRLSNKPLRVYL